MLLHLPDDTLSHILNYNKQIKLYNNYLTICKSINTLIIDDYKRIYKQFVIIYPLIQLWKYLSHNTKIMYNIKNKLYKYHVIIYNYYCILNANSIEEFKTSIGWTDGQNLHDNLWIDIFFLNGIKWTSEEILFFNFYFNLNFNSDCEYM
jgi:hypothetical protein